MSEEKSLLAIMNEDFQEAASSQSAEAYTKLSGTLEKMRAELRDYGQKLAINEMKAVLRKLKNEETLSDDDRGKLQSWIVGDAEYYINKEHNFDNWSGRLQRLIGEIRESWMEHPDDARLLKLRSLAKDALTIVGDLSFYIKQKESVEKFHAATKAIGESERVVLVSLLEQKISTSRF